MERIRGVQDQQVWPSRCHRGGRCLGRGCQGDKVGLGDAPGWAGVSQASPKLQHVPLGGDKVPLCHQ